MKFRKLIKDEYTKTDKYVTEKVDITKIDNNTLSELKDAYYNTADNIYSMKEIINSLDGFDEMKTSINKLVKIFDAFDKKFDFGKKL